MDERPALLALLADAMNGQLMALLHDAGFNGQAGQNFLVPTLGAVHPRRVVLVGTGVTDGDADVRRRGWSDAARAAERAGSHQIGLATTGLDERGIREALEGIALGSYRFTTYFGSLREREEEQAAATYFLLGGDRTSLESISNEVTAIARGVFLARDLVSTPASDLNPQSMAARATAIAEEQGLEVTVLGVKDLERLGAGAILAVGKGSDIPPSLIHLVYRPDGEVTGPPVGLVGKCITFDTGGYSIKTGEGMLQMKTDMAGGAAVLGAMSALRELGACPWPRSRPSPRGAG